MLLVHWLLLIAFAGLILAVYAPPKTAMMGGFAMVLCIGMLGLELFNQPLPEDPWMRFTFILGPYGYEVLVLVGGWWLCRHFMKPAKGPPALPK